MTAKGKVRVIKKGSIKNETTSATSEKKATQASAREMVSTVTNWISDIQQKRREETKQALETLFKNNPHASGV